MSSMKLLRSFELKSFEDLRPGELFLAGWAGGLLLAIAVSSDEAAGGRAVAVLSSPDPDRRAPFLSNLRIAGSVMSLGTDWIIEPDLKGPVRTAAKVLGLDPGSIAVSRDAEFLRVATLDPESWSALSLDLRTFEVRPHPKAAPGEDFASIDGWALRLKAEAGAAGGPFFTFSAADARREAGGRDLPGKAPAPKAADHGKAATEAVDLSRLGR